MPSTPRSVTKVHRELELSKRQRIDHAFEFQVQAIRVAKDKELCILDAVVFTTIAPTTDDHDDDNLSHHLNDLVKGVIERDTRALAAPMTMADIFRATTSPSPSSGTCSWSSSTWAASSSTTPTSM